jgi:hypothetical protein
MNLTNTRRTTSTLADTRRNKTKRTTRKQHFI